MAPGKLIRTPLLPQALFLTFTPSLIAQLPIQINAIPEVAKNSDSVEQGGVVYTSDHDLILSRSC